MGSEMCIRDRTGTARGLAGMTGAAAVEDDDVAEHGPLAARDESCLLYTSDAADERSSVDLGGRRIIKKKK